MKTKNLLQKIILINMLLFSLCVCGSESGSDYKSGQPSQSIDNFRIDLIGGFGFPDLLHGGLRAHLGPNYRIGFTVGSLPMNNEEEGAFAFSIDNYATLNRNGKPAKDPWYLRFGINYFRWETEKKITKDTHLNLSFGKEARISDFFGINIDAGLNIPINHKVERKVPETSSWFNFDIFPEPCIYPGIRVGIYCRF
ncbi:MAG: hypothetical protein K8S16_08850 [Bacteroidales bacterium]|nr:hypothetical protein [Bacteroidales bacterium]